jgi:hypothetical protein
MAKGVGCIDWEEARKEKSRRLIPSLVSSKREQSTVLKRRHEHRVNED